SPEALNREVLMKTGASLFCAKSKNSCIREVLIDESDLGGILYPDSYLIAAHIIIFGVQSPYS
ncbi:hypothetical protein EU77_00240, partial [Mesotoga sp. SC_NapDC]